MRNYIFKFKILLNIQRKNRYLSVKKKRLHRLHSLSHVELIYFKNLYYFVRIRKTLCLRQLNLQKNSNLQIF